MKVDLTQDRPEDLDAMRVPAGYYLVTCTAHEKGHEHEEIIWKFRVDSALFKGQTLESRLGNPEMAMSDEDAKGQWKRLKIWFKRLGLVSDADAGKNVEVNPAGCVGKQFVLQMADNFFVGKKGDQVNIPRPGYAGIYGLDHPEVPPAERVRLGLRLLPGQNVDEAATAPKKGGRPAKGKGDSAAEKRGSDGGPLGFDPSEI